MGAVSSAPTAIDLDNAGVEVEPVRLPWSDSTTEAEIDVAIGALRTIAARAHDSEPLRTVA
jgi:hypothetical protein